MEFSYLSSSVSIKTISEDAKEGVFEIDGLYAGYGLTIGTRFAAHFCRPCRALRLPKKRKGISHEFSTLPGLQEDIVELSLNFKKLFFRMHVDEPQVLLLKMKGEGEITAGDIELNSNVEIINPDEVIAVILRRRMRKSIWKFALSAGWATLPLRAASRRSLADRNDCHRRYLYAGYQSELHD